MYDELYGQFRELTLATLPHAHALAAWQRDRDEPRDLSDRHPAHDSDAIRGRKDLPLPLEPRPPRGVGAERSGRPPGRASVSSR